MGLVQRAIDVTVTLGKGSFGESGSDTVKLTGYRVSATIEKSGIPASNTAQIRIYGMDLSLMKQLSQIGLVFDATRRNLVSVMAGESDAGMSLVFTGGIVSAWMDFNGAPETSFVITAQTAYLAAMKAVPPTSYPGATDVAVIMANLAKQMGYSFENNGVSVILSSPYLPGTARQQAVAAAAAADIFLVLEDDDGIMAIAPKNGVRGLPVPVISAATGMVGYPDFGGPGIVHVKTLFNPGIRFLGNVQIETILTPSAGLWTVLHLTHSLEAQNPDGGDWFSEIDGGLYLARGVPPLAAA